MARSTRQRDALRHALAHAGRPMSPQELLLAAQVQVPALGLATVYRNLKALAEAGEVELVSLPGQAPRYESAGHGHHHHFQCKSCDRVFEVHGCPSGLSELAPPGFELSGHELTLYGRCADCATHLRPAAALRSHP